MVYKEIVLESLEELADPAYQRRVWLASSGEVSSYIECACHLFDDSGLSFAFEKGEEVFGDSLDQGLRDLERAMDEVDEFLGPEELIELPQMKVVREMAADLLNRLRAGQ